MRLQPASLPKVPVAACSDSRVRGGAVERRLFAIRQSHATFSRKATLGRIAGSCLIRRGERLPDTVEVEEFPDTVYREAPSSQLDELRMA
jgi:hypothetical protein